MNKDSLIQDANTRDVHNETRDALPKGFALVKSKYGWAVENKVTNSFIIASQSTPEAAIKLALRRIKPYPQADTRKPLWQIAAESAISVKCEAEKAGYKLNEKAISKISKVIRDNLFASNI